jgi:hypothetical protein
LTLPQRQRICLRYWHQSNHNNKDNNEDATSLAHRSAAQQKLFQWEYERWERKDLEFRRQKKALAEFNSEIGKTIASKHLYLIENKDTPHD